jgi:hypothetical protein
LEIDHGTAGIQTFHHEHFFSSPHWLPG